MNAPITGPKGKQDRAHFSRLHWTCRKGNQATAPIAMGLMDDA